MGVYGFEDRAIVLLMRDDVAAKADAHGAVGTAHLPGVPLLQPFVGDLHLVPVDDLLFE